MHSFRNCGIEFYRSLLKIIYSPSRILNLFILSSTACVSCRIMNSIESSQLYGSSFSQPTEVS